MDPDWGKIMADLKAPFPGDAVSWRPQGKANNQGKTQVTAYIDARDVMDRLDAVVGPEHWEFDWLPVVTDAKGLLVAKGTLMIYGVPKSDVGDASNFEANKGAVSDAFKRAAVHWGVARYLYELPSVWVELQDGRIPPAKLAELQKRLSQREHTEKGEAAQPQQQKPPLQQPAPKAPPQTTETDGQPANEQQLTSIHKLCVALGREEPDPATLNFTSAGALIRQLSRDYNATRRAS